MVDKAKNVKQEAKTVSKNFAEFAEASALAGVSGFAIYSGLQNDSLAYKALGVAGVLIALRATQLLVKHFNK